MTPEIPPYYLVYLPASPWIYNLVFTTSIGCNIEIFNNAAPTAQPRFLPMKLSDFLSLFLAFDY